MMPKVNGKKTTKKAAPTKKGVKKVSPPHRTVAKRRMPVKAPIVPRNVARDLAELSDREGLPIAYVARSADILAKVGLTPADVTGATVSHAQHHAATDWQTRFVNRGARR